MIRHHKQRAQVAETALSLVTTGLVVNTSGNVSIREADDIIITPSSRAYDSLSAEDICVISLQGEWLAGEHLPSSETPLHLDVYNSNSEIKAIVHTHSVHATAVSTLVKILPAIHYQMADLGGPIPVAPYATFGSQELADSVLNVLPGRNAALMQNHGSITTADTLEKALARTIALEWCCEVWLKAVTAGEPSILNEEQMEAARQQMADLVHRRESSHGCKHN